MTYTIYDNSGSSSSYSANPGDSLSASEVTYRTGSWGTGGKKSDFTLEAGGEDYNDFTEDTDNNTYTVVNGTTAVDPGDVVEIKYDKDDDGGGGGKKGKGGGSEIQDIDVVRVNLEGFDSDFTLALKSAQTADRLYLTNVLSFKVGNDSTVNFNATTPDTNSNIFGQRTFRIDDDKSSAATVTYLDANNNVRTINITLGGGGASNMQVMVRAVCFTRGTMIDTQDGPKPIEDIAVGDRVKTKDNGFQTIKWCANRVLSETDLKQQPHLRPIRIRAGALGDNLPAQDLVVSPQHRMLVSGPECELFIGESEVLVPAKALLNDHSITLDYDATRVEYFHFMCDHHEVVYANGAESESFHPGDFGLSAIDEPVREELFMVFPQLDRDIDSYGPTARPVLKAFEANWLLKNMRSAA